MRKEYNKHKISLYGSMDEIAKAEEVLNELPLTGSEYNDRLMIQKNIDVWNLRAGILYDGNIVWSYKRIINDFNKALKSKSGTISEYGNGNYQLTDYLYDFLHLSCGSIAHYNKYGWIGEYPAKNDLANFILKNEFGESIIDHQPFWKSDAQKIAKELTKIAKEKLNGTYV